MPLLAIQTAVNGTSAAPSGRWTEISLLSVLESSVLRADFKIAADQSHGRGSPRNRPLAGRTRSEEGAKPARSTSQATRENRCEHGGGSWEIGPEAMAIERIEKLIEFSEAGLEAPPPPVPATAYRARRCAACVLDGGVYRRAKKPAWSAQ